MPLPEVVQRYEKLMVYRRGHSETNLRLTSKPAAQDSGLHVCSSARAVTATPLSVYQTRGVVSGFVSS